MSNCFECKHLTPRTFSGLRKCLKAHNYFRPDERETMQDSYCSEFEPIPTTRAHCERPECAYCGEPISWHSLFAASYPCPKCHKESKVETTYTSTGVENE